MMGRLPGGCAMAFGFFAAAELVKHWMLAKTEDVAESAHRRLAMAGVENLYWLHDGTPAWAFRLQFGANLSLLKV